MDDKIEETIKAIAVKHGLVLGPDDPILVLQTINDRLLQDGRAAQQEILSNFKSELETIAHQWGNEAKNKAEMTINAALTISRKAMLQCMQEGAKTAAAQLCQEIEPATTRIIAAIRESRRVAVMNMIAAGLTVLAAGMILWGSKL